MPLFTNVLEGAFSEVRRKRTLHRAVRTVYIEGELYEKRD